MTEYYEDLIKRLNAYCAEYEKHGGITAEAADTIKELAADATPIVHARWIWYEDDWEYECSACRVRFDYDKTYGLFDHGFNLAHYCPHCGAKMDERIW